MGGMIRIIGMLFGSLIVGGCAPRASLRIDSQPAGASITELETGKAYGPTPVIVFYDPSTLLQHKNAEGCFLVKGFEARWTNGAHSMLNPIKLCGSQIGTYNISLQSNAAPLASPHAPQPPIANSAVAPAMPSGRGDVFTVDQFNAIKRENSVAAKARFSAIGVVTVVGKVARVRELGILMSGDEPGSGDVDCEFPETRKGWIVPPAAAALHKDDYVAMRGIYGGGLRHPGLINCQIAQIWRADQLPRVTAAPPRVTVPQAAAATSSGPPPGYYQCYSLSLMRQSNYCEQGDLQLDGAGHYLTTRGSAGQYGFDAGSNVLSFAGGILNGRMALADRISDGTARFRIRKNGQGLPKPKQGFDIYTYEHRPSGQRTNP